MASQRKNPHLQYRAYDSTNIQRTLPNKIEYDGPKTFDEIVLRISFKTGIPKPIVKQCITRFIKVAVFDRFLDGKTFSLRGLGKFMPWQSTKTRASRGQTLIKHNVDRTSLYHNRKRRNFAVRRALKKKIKKDAINQKNLKSGWDF